MLMSENQCRNMFRHVYSIIIIDYKWCKSASLTLSRQFWWNSLIFSQFLTILTPFWPRFDAWVPPKRVFVAFTVIRSKYISFNTPHKWIIPLLLRGYRTLGRRPTGHGIQDFGCLGWFWARKTQNRISNAVPLVWGVYMSQNTPHKLDIALLLSGQPTL